MNEIYGGVSPATASHPFSDYGSTATSTAGMSSSSYTSSSREYANVGYRIPVPALIAHGFMMSLAVGVFLPIGAMIMQVVPWNKKVTRLHAPIQAFALAMLLSGMGIGIYLGVTTHKIRYYHPIIGFIVVGGLLLFQPLMGLYSHLHFQKTGTKSVFAYVHRWWGRIMVILGIINGGLGFRLARIGLTGTPVGAVVAYSIVAGVIISAYLVVIIFGTARQVTHHKLGSAL